MCQIYQLSRWLASHCLGACKLTSVTSIDLNHGYSPLVKVSSGQKIVGDRVRRLLVYTTPVLINLRACSIGIWRRHDDGRIVARPYASCTVSLFPFYDFSTIPTILDCPKSQTLMQVASGSQIHFGQAANIATWPSMLIRCNTHDYLLASYLFFENFSTAGTEHTRTLCPRK